MSRKSSVITKKPRTVRGSAARAAAHLAGGDAVRAANDCRLALERAPRDAGLWHLLAVAELSAGDADAAEQAAREACTLAPHAPDHQNTLALSLERQGRKQDAARLWSDCLAVHPRHADSAYNLGRLELARGDFVTASACFERALAARPEWAEAWCNLGHARHAAGDARGAEDAFIAATRHAPQAVEPYTNLARLREEAGDFDAAMAWYKRALECGVEPATLLRFALACPIFAVDAADIAAHRARVADNLARLAGHLGPLQDPATAVGTPSFYFAYQGANDRELMAAIDAVTRGAWQPPALPTVLRGAHRPRVAVVSAYLHAHTIGRLYAPLLEALPREEFELAVVAVGARTDALAQRIAAAADRHIAVAAEHGAARQALAALDADVVFFPDVGMDPATTWLAAERFAPVQCVGWGHPVTTGRASMDYFVSSTLLEPDDAARHYTEALVNLPAWPVIYEDPGMPSPRPSRTSFGFAADERIYLCPQSLFKLHPDFDAYLGAILAADPDGRVILIESRAPWRDRLEQRFAAHLGPLAQRIEFVPAQDPVGFKALLAAADVVLDTIHFSGGYTSFETLWAEVPFVTERGAFMRGRVTAGLADLLELPEAIARGAVDYAVRAVELAHAGPVRARFVDALRERKYGLLELAPSVVPAYCDFIGHALEQAAARRGGA
ncbi:MAG: tetratricopeptide repeat protein [Gammaproteobacteria bacterium]